MYSTIRIIKHHKGNLENRLEACMSRRYHLESLNVTKMHIKAIQTTSAAFRHFLKRHDVEKVAEIKDTLEEMIEERKESLLGDLTKVRAQGSELERQKLENIALQNALTGAIQQCDDFLKKLGNESSDEG